MNRPQRRIVFGYAVALTVGYPPQEARALAVAWARHAPGGDGEDYFAGLWCELEEDGVRVKNRVYTAEDFTISGHDADLAAMLDYISIPTLVTLDETDLAVSLFVELESLRSTKRRS